MRSDDMRNKVLVVDLDGSLLRSDMLLESFWASFARDWRTPLRAVAALVQGRAALKARMAEGGAPDPATLPYDEAVLARIAAWREDGGRVALVTAADQSLAEAIGAYLGLFDSVHGSDGQTNLKGEAKADFLDIQFGPGGYAYVGDSPADLAVWRRAAQAFTVGASPALRARVEALQPDVTHLSPPATPFRAMLRAMRPHQWLKNVLVFFPLIAAHRFDGGTLAQGLMAFLAFGLVASSVYVLNDLLDLGADRAHPRKRNRPLASGALPLRLGMMMVPVLLGAGLAVGLAVAPAFLGVLVLYYLLTVTYSLWLKRKLLIDVLVLAMLYALRVIAGAAATDIGLSVWLVAFSLFLFLALAAVKRLAELVDAAERGVANATGRGYLVKDLPVVSQMAMTSGFAAVLVLMLYLDAPEVAANYSSPMLLSGACLVLLYWVVRMVMLANRGQMDDDPVVFAARDRVSNVALALIAALFIGASVL